jgi:hypothetical protein
VGVIFAFIGVAWNVALVIFGAALTEWLWAMLPA